jgi:hypothetical protein
LLPVLGFEVVLSGRPGLSIIDPVVVVVAALEDVVRRQVEVDGSEGRGRA